MKSTLLTLPREGLTSQLATALPRVPSAAQPAVLEVLAARQATDQLSAVLPFLKNTNAEVKAAAFGALKSMTTANDLPTLYTLLNTVTDPQEIAAVQSALGQSVKGAGSIAAQSSLILKQMQESPADKRPHYLAVLAEYWRT